MKLSRPFVAGLVGWLFLGVMGACDAAGPAGAQMPIPADSAMGKADGGLQRLLLNALQGGAGIKPDGWRLGGGAAGVAGPDVPAKFGSAAAMFKGQAEVDGAKGDFDLTDDVPGACRMVGMWVYIAPDANVAKVGFQIYDKEGEALIMLIPADWTGWKWVEADLKSSAFTPAYAQAEKNGKVDTPLKTVHAAWFAKTAGPTRLAVNALCAVSDLSANKPQRPLEMQLSGATIAQPGEPLAALLSLTNLVDKPAGASVEFSVQRDGDLFDRIPPDPIFGSDRGLGKKNWTEADGKIIEEGSLTDGKSWTGAETPETKPNWEEVFQYIDLGQSRKITKMTWEAGDANWVAKVDVSGSPDGKTYTPVPSLQNTEVYKKWGHQKFPLAEPFEARFLRFRYHNNGAKAPRIRMPVGISVYDGIEGESMELPVVGPVAAAGKVDVTVPGRSFVAVPLSGKDLLSPGAYLVAVKLQAEKTTYLSWQHLMVMPLPLKATEKSRMGLNADDPAAMDMLQKLGVGWIRFENMKWPFTSSEKGVFKYDGSIAPWRVNFDAIFEGYKAHDINVLPYLFLTQNYETPPGAPLPTSKITYPPKDFAGYGEFAYQTAARFGSTKHPVEDLKTPDKRSGLGLVKVFELWNEPNLNNPEWGHWKGPISQYYELFRVGAEAVKKADPTARVANGGYSGIGLELVDQLRSHKYADGKCPLDFVDVLSVHFYTGRMAPEICRFNANTGAFQNTDPRTFEENLQLLNAWRDRNKPGTPIWLTETGYENDGDFGIGERMQAAYLPRDVMLILASGVEKVMVFRETGSDSFRWGSSGVLRTDYSAKPSYFTYGTLIRELDGVEGPALRVASDQGNIRVLAWKKGTQTILTAWAVEGTAAFPLNLGKATVTDAFGGKREGVDTAALKLTDFPIYLRDFSDAKAVEAVLTKANQDEQRRKDTLQQQVALKAYLYAFGSADQVGSFIIGDLRRCTPVLAGDLYSDAKGYGFQPAALQNDVAEGVADPLKRNACRLAKGTQFRLRADPGKYVLRINVVPFERQGQLTIGGLAGGDKTVTVAKQKGEVELEVEVAAAPISIQMDGYAGLHWVTLVRQTTGK